MIKGNKLRNPNRQSQTMKIICHEYIYINRLSMEWGAQRENDKKMILHTKRITILNGNGSTFGVQCTHIRL